MKYEDEMIRELFGELSEEEREAIGSELEAQPELRSERDRLAAVVEKYTALGEDDPSPGLSALPEPAGRKPSRGSRRTRAMRIAAVLALGIATFLIGRQVSQREASEDSVGAPAATRDAERPQPGGAMTMPRQEHAANRIVALRNLLEDGEISTAMLLSTLRSDPSSNVRLTAIDLLFESPEAAPSTDDLAEILEREPSVALRCAMVEWLAAARPSGWAELLEATEREDADPSVRRRARAFGGEGRT